MMSEPRRYSGRTIEWMLSLVMLIWAALLLADPDMFELPIYVNFRLLLPEEAWIVIFVVLAGARFNALARNGPWRWSAIWRAAVALAGAMIWAMFAVAFILADPPVPSAWATYPVFVLCELISLWRAVRDNSEKAAREARYRSGVLARDT